VTDQTPDQDEPVRLEMVAISNPGLKGQWVPLAVAQREVGRLRGELERVKAFAFGDAPEWVQANSTLKHRVRELEAEAGELREKGDRLADAVRALDSYAAMGGAPMERTERADAALKAWDAVTDATSEEDQ
jgi:hypothetical protein